MRRCCAFSTARKGRATAWCWSLPARAAPAGSATLYEERGILRRLVPHWLGLPDLRSLVIGFEEASAHHGGSGALYVRLRRRRGADAP